MEPRIAPRSCATLLWYTQETNQNLCQWLNRFFHENEVPLRGEWSAVSGDDLLRKMLSMDDVTIENPYTFERFTIDPRNSARAAAPPRHTPRPGVNPEGPVSCAHQLRGAFWTLGSTWLKSGWLTSRT